MAGAPAASRSALTAPPPALRCAFAAARRVGWSRLPGAVDPAGAGALVSALASRPTPLTGVVGPVRQKGTVRLGVVAGEPTLEAVAAAIGSATDGAFVPNEAVLQGYPADGFISPHRDNGFYVGFVAVLTLAGRTSFRVVADRAATTVLDEWETRPGDLVVLRGVGAGGGARPLHAVGRPLRRPGEPAEPRTSLTLRQTTRTPGRFWS